jgi:hypothetical protein
MSLADLAVVWLFLCGLFGIAVLLYGLWKGACRLFDVLLNHSAQEIDRWS